MTNQEQLVKDYELLEIDINTNENITERYVTLKYKKRARIVHPDKIGGNKSDFQELLNAYRRIIKHLENMKKEGEVEAEDDPEKEFFMKHNFMKECTNSIVVYVEDGLVDKWKQVLMRHLSFQNMDKCRIIFKSSILTVTLYARPKKDPRSKIHIQSGNQKANLDFVMDTMANLYQEVCKQVQLDIDPRKIRAVQRAICGKCGKNFINKKGVKQHILRMHVNKPKILSIEDNVETNIEKITAEEEDTGEKSSPIRPSSFRDIISVEFTPNISPIAKKKRVTSENIMENEKEGQDVIKSLLKELQDTAVDQSKEQNIEENQNYQCGECGKIFPPESDVDVHMKEKHTVESEITKQLSNAYEQIEKLQTKIEVLIKANVEGEKENNRNKLALAESIFEIQELKKEVENRNEVVNEKVKENTALKEELKVKNEIINNLKEVGGNSEEITETNNEEGNTMDVDGNMFKCKQCSFKTKKKQLLNGHAIAHTGQYQCQQCKSAYKSWKNLDDHIKKDHGNSKQSESFNCEECGLIFNAAFHLRKHMEKNHTKLPKFECENCGWKVQNDLQLIRHKLGCTGGFEEIQKQSCRYFVKGNCWKGNQCKFYHEENRMKSSENTPDCKNGPGCPYLSRGVCRFSHVTHRNVPSSENNKIRNNDKWCRYQEQCYKIPNCGFVHRDSDFPNLPKTNNPPLWENIKMWLEY